MLFFEKNTSWSNLTHTMEHNVMGLVCYSEEYGRTHELIYCVLWYSGAGWEFSRSKLVTENKKRGVERINFCKPFCMWVGRLFSHKLGQDVRQELRTRQVLCQLFKSLPCCCSNYLPLFVEMMRLASFSKMVCSGTATWFSCRSMAQIWSQRCSSWPYFHQGTCVAKLEQVFLVLPDLWWLWSCYSET